MAGGGRSAFRGPRQGPWPSRRAALVVRPQLPRLRLPALLAPATPALVRSRGAMAPIARREALGVAPRHLSLPRARASVAAAAVRGVPGRGAMLLVGGVLPNLHRQPPLPRQSALSGGARRALLAPAPILVAQTTQGADGLIADARPLGAALRHRRTARAGRGRAGPPAMPPPASSREGTRRPRPSGCGA